MIDPADPAYKRLTNCKWLERAAFFAVGFAIGANLRPLLLMLGA